MDSIFEHWDQDQDPLLIPESSDYSEIYSRYGAFAPVDYTEEKKLSITGDYYDEDGPPFIEREFTEEEKKFYSSFDPYPTREEIVIAFVKSLERVHQLFDFWAYLKEEQCGFIKHDSRRQDVFVTLVKRPERKTLFNLLDEQTIVDAIFAHIKELQTQERSKSTPLIHVNPHVKKRYEFINAMFDSWTLEAENAPVSDPILEFVYRARHGHPMHENPQVELDKMKEMHPLFYRGHFMFNKIKPKFEQKERTVMVTNLSDGHTDEKLKDLLSICGEVESIERTHSFLWPEIANVTFKNSEAAKIAPFVMGPNSVSIRRIPESDDEESDVEEAEDVSSLYEQALSKYSELLKTCSGSKEEVGSKSPGASLLE